MARPMSRQYPSISLLFLLSIWSLLIPGSHQWPGVNPVYLPPGQGASQWYGPDGLWSSVLLNVGTPPRPVYVIPTTQTDDMWVVRDTGCDSEYWNKNLSSACTTDRGGTFDTSESSTWDDLKLNADVFSEQRLITMGYSLLANYGLDTVTINSNGSTYALKSHAMAVFENSTEFITGTMGLNVHPISFDGVTKYTSLLNEMYMEKMVPSQSFGFTAGASYRENKVPCSVVLGGFDLDRFVLHDRIFTLSSDLYPTAGLQAITANSSTANNASFLTDAIEVYIDSTTPYYWLPTDVCESIASLLGLEYDTGTELYFYKSKSAYKTAKENDYTFYFTLTNYTDGSGQSITLNLPFLSFDLTHSDLNDTSVPDRPYFPMKRAADSTIYTLGRAFLQETYLIVDIYRVTFSIHQAWFPGNTGSTQNVVTITDPGTDGPGANVTSTVGGHAAATSLPPNASGSLPQSPTGTSGSGSSNPSGGGSSPETSSGPASSSSGKSNKGAVIGGAVAGAVVALALLGVLIFCLRKRRNNKKAQAIINQPNYFPEDADAYDGVTSPTVEKPAELAHTSPRHELPGHTIPQELEAEVDPAFIPEQKFELDATGANLDRHMSDDSKDSDAKDDLLHAGPYNTEGNTTVSSLTPESEAQRVSGSEVSDDGRRSFDDNVSEPSARASNDGSHPDSHGSFIVSPITPTWSHAFHSHADGGDLGGQIITEEREGRDHA